MIILVKINDNPEICRCFDRGDKIVLTPYVEGDVWPNCHSKIIVIDKDNFLTNKLPIYVIDRIINSPINDLIMDNTWPANRRNWTDTIKIENIKLIPKTIEQKLFI